MIGCVTCGCGYNVQGLVTGPGKSCKEGEKWQVPVIFAKRIPGKKGSVRRYVVL